MKKYVIKSLLLLMMLFMVVSCREPINKIKENLTVPKYTVTFDSAGGSLVSSTEALENSLATEPTAPTKVGYTLGGWYTDNNTFTNKWDFATNKVTGNITLYAKWIAGIKSITAGVFHTMILKNDGTLWATGKNNFGQLGIGNYTNKSSFTQVIF